MTEIKKGFLTEDNGKPSSQRLAKTTSFFVGIGLVVLQAVTNFIAFLNGQPSGHIADFQFVLLLLGTGAGLEAFNVMSKKVSKKNGNDSV